MNTIDPKDTFYTQWLNAAREIVESETIDYAKLFDFAEGTSGLASNFGFRALYYSANRERGYLGAATISLKDSLDFAREKTTHNGTYDYNSLITNGPTTSNMNYKGMGEMLFSGEHKQKSTHALQSVVTGLITIIQPKDRSELQRSFDKFAHKINLG